MIEQQLWEALEAAADLETPRTTMFRLMVAEEAARQTQPPPPFADLTPDQQMAELIFQLREQADGSGVVLRAWRLPFTRTVPTNRTWGQNGKLMIDREQIWRASGGSAYRHGKTDECWRDLRAALTTAFAGPRDTAVLLHLRTTLEQTGVWIAEN